ncbi:hypothetical protein D3C75_1271310 [compost metagenome]
MRLPGGEPQTMCPVGIDMKIKRNPLAAQRSGEQQAVLHRHTLIIRGMPEECRRCISWNLQLAAELTDQLLSGMLSEQIGF